MDVEDVEEGIGVKFERKLSVTAIVAGDKPCF